MSTMPAPVAQPQRTDDDDLVHIYCCNPDRSWCGKNLSGIPETPDAPEWLDCVVCVDLDDNTERCCATCPGREAGR